MKTIGLIGGMSWESSIEYYRLINQQVKAKLGGLHSAKVIMNSLNFVEIVECQQAGDWEKASMILSNTAKSLEDSGADFVLLCTNTMHKLSEQIQSAINVPFIHIADVTAEQIKSNGLKKVALLGTKYTMEQDFYRQRLESHGLQVIIPNSADVQIVNDVIFDELCKGKILESSKEQYKRIINELAQQGAEGVILGCTEIPLLIKAEDSVLPIFDTTEIHATKAVELALSEDNVAILV